jgi:hypothetical protein
MVNIVSPVAGNSAKKFSQTWRLSNSILIDYPWGIVWQNTRGVVITLLSSSYALA